MGGIPTNVDAQVRSDHAGGLVPGLFAAGECACVSVHGANRLGTNSLLDIVVFGRRGGIAMAEYASTAAKPGVQPNAHEGMERRLAGLYDGGGPEYIAPIREKLQTEMMDKASVVRTEDSLAEMEEILSGLRARYDQCRVRDRSKVFNTEICEHLELGFMLDMAEALVVSARARTESRGGHYREDHTMREDDHWLKHSFITKTDGGTKLDYRDVVLGRYEPVERKY
jgi:succinate dehydrogenase / fumarate reductase flavoprotein subunit